MRLTSYGKDVIIKVFLAGLMLLLVSFFIHNALLKLVFSLSGIFIWLFTLYFFRDPERKLPASIGINSVVSPGDGKIVLIENIINKEKNIFEANESLVQISIFLSPLDVHVNRIPLTGRIEFLKYIEGEYIVAFDHKSSDRNERTEIGIENKQTHHKILFKQIAGFVARRIVYRIKEGDEVKAGDRFGMIKFGSRIDMLMKADAKILIEKNQRVTGGETIIAEL